MHFYALSFSPMSGIFLTSYHAIIQPSHPLIWVYHVLHTYASLHLFFFYPTTSLSPPK